MLDDVTTCIGVDVTWWGGRPNDRASSWETLIRATGSGPIAHERIDLRSRPTEGAATDYSLPSHDADASLLIDAVARHLPAEPEGRVVLAVDAPLHTTRRGLPPRTRHPLKGSKGSQYRSCDRLMAAYKRASSQPWRSAPQGTVQPGAPIPMRIDALVSTLCERHGFTVWDGATPFHELRSRRVLLEVFPAGSIWALGAQGHYGDVAPSAVGAYKSAAARRRLTRDEALATALLPLDGFARVLDSSRSRGLRPLELPRDEQRSYATAIAELAVRASSDDAGVVRLGKTFDDVIDSGLAFLTGLAWIAGRSFTLRADDGDGHIVLPGDLGALARQVTGMGAR